MCRHQICLTKHSFKKKKEKKEALRSNTTVETVDARAVAERWYPEVQLYVVGLLHRQFGKM